MNRKFGMLVVTCALLNACSPPPPPCGDTKTTEAVQLLLKQAVEKDGEGKVERETFDQAWSAVRFQVQTPTTTGHDKSIGKLSCEAIVSVTTPFPPEVLWSYPTVHETLGLRFPGKEPGGSSTASPSELRSSLARYSSQFADDRKTHIVKIEGHERLAMLVAALVEGHAFAPRLIELEEQPPTNPAQAREFVDHAAQKMGSDTFTAPSQFIKDPVINATFTALIGKQLEAFQYNLSVSNGVELNGDYIVSEGIAPHLGGIEEAAFAISTRTGAVTAVLHTDDKLQLFGVKTEADLPSPLYKWLRRRTIEGTPLRPLTLDSALCSTLRTIAADRNLHVQANALTLDVVACTSNTNCTHFDNQKYPPARAALVAITDEEDRKMLSGADAYLLDINNDNVSDIWVQSIGGTLSCVTSIPLIGKLVSGGADPPTASYSFAFDERFKDLKLQECGIDPSYLRFRNYVFSAISLTMGSDSNVAVRVGTPSGFQSCDKQQPTAAAPTPKD